jgi:penicillin-binding protein 1C
LFRPRVLAAATLCAAAVAAGAWLADRAYPPDLTRLEERSTVVAAADGAMLRAFTNAHGRLRMPIAADTVDPNYLRLLIAIEDQRFRDHAGVDPLAVARALGQMASNRRIVSGASTLTMQVARLLEPRPRGFTTKLIQAARALQLERRHDKDQILAMYLALAPFGGNIEGVRAASLVWFGREPARLTLAESALLVALPQSPERLRPDRHRAAAKRARDRIIARARELALVSADEAAEAIAAPVPEARQPLPFHAPHLAERLARTAAAGVSVTTTIDARLQRRIEELVAREAHWIDDGAAIAIVVVETTGRRVRAWVGNTEYFGPHGQVDLARRPRSPGSALKPFIYALAFADGIAHPDTLIDDIPMRFGGWSPRNFDRVFQGRLTVREALQQSLNVPAVALLDRVGPTRLALALRESGARVAFRTVTGRASLAIALGGLGVSLADLTMLYAGLADGGVVRPLSFTPDEEPATPHRFANADAARQVIDILAGTPLPEGWAQASVIERPRSIAFKTGTSYGYRDAWAIGSSARWTVGVWVGRADGTARPGRYARNTAAPLLMKVYDLLPPDGAVRAPQVELTATRAPLGMRYFQPPEARNLTPLLGRPPRILFPPDGATVEIDVDDLEAGLDLRAEGEGPLTWVVNGAPLPAAELGRQTIWQPDGEGFASVTVVDRAGRTAQARVRVVVQR